MAKTTRIRLDVEPDPEVHVIGISSHVNDYRLCWSLNLSLGIALTRRDRDILDSSAEGTSRHAAFDHDDPGYVLDVVSVVGRRRFVELPEPTEGQTDLAIPDNTPARPESL